MTMFQRIREAGFRFISKLFNRDDDDGLDMGAIEGSLTEYVHELNEHHSTAVFFPLKRG